MKDIIEMKSLTKKFGSFTAVDRINLKIREGEISGFLGPNGAGKTTTISMLTTLIKPTSGTALVAGHDILTEGVKVRSVIGVVPQSFSLFPELTAQENLSYIGKLYGMSPSKIKESSEYLLKTVGLYEHRGRIAGIFSGGMKQRLSLAAGIISNPKILFMDEPTTGLDPQSRIAIRELTKHLNQQGITIVYTTHDMDEAEKICDRIIIMDAGRIVADGTSKELKDRINSHFAIEIELERPSRNIVSELKKLPGVLTVTQDGRLINVTVKDKKGVVHKLSAYLHKKNQTVNEICVKKPTLEEVFIKLTREDLRDSP
jgi:ABC-2 type transport system ATP-binding protein